MTAWGLHVLLLTFIGGTTHFTNGQQTIVLYTYGNNLNTPVCYAPVDAVLVISDYDGLLTTDPAYGTFYSNILDGFELRQQGTVRLAVILTSSVFPGQREIGYTLEVSGNDVIATIVHDNAQVTPLPALLDKIRTEVLPSSGPSRRMLLFLTDEVNELDIDGTMRTTRELRDEGYVVLGITSSKSRRVTAVLGEMTGNADYVFSYDSSQEMAQNVNTILSTVCNGRSTSPPTLPLEVYTSPTTVAVPPPQSTTNVVQPQPLPATAAPRTAAPRTTAPAKPTFAPVSTEISVTPEFGPESGRTLVTLVGQRLQQQVLLIRISSVPCEVVSQYGSTIKCRTSSRPSSVLVNQPLEIVIIPSSGISISIPNAFTYKPDPIVTDIYPLNTIVSGGILVTVDGTNLDSVAEASLVVNAKLGGVIQNSFTEKCIARTPTNVFCPTPKIDVPEASSQNVFKRSLDSRIKRQALPGLLNNGYLDFSVGVKLDGLSIYTDYKSLDVYIDPYIYPFDQSPYSHNSGDHIDIRGANLTLALRVEDYTVVIGDVKCEILRLSFNRITCRPGRSPSDSSKATDGTYPVQVSVGTANLQFYVGGLTYNSGYWKGLWPTVAGVLGAFGLFLSIITIFIVRCVRKGDP